MKTRKNKRGGSKGNKGNKLSFRKKLQNNEKCYKKSEEDGKTIYRYINTSNDRDCIKKQVTLLYKDLKFLKNFEKKVPNSELLHSIKSEDFTGSHASEAYKDYQSKVTLLENAIALGRTWHLKEKDKNEDK